MAQRKKKRRQTLKVLLKHTSVLTRPGTYYIAFVYIAEKLIISRNVEELKKAIRWADYIQQIKVADSHRKKNSSLKY